MTRIDAMDEFFNFEEATNPAMVVVNGPQSLTSSPHLLPAAGYDIDLILAQAANDDVSFNSYQHTGGDATAGPFQYSSGRLSDVDMGGAHDFDGYNPWLNNARRSSNACVNCRTNKLDCVFNSTSSLLQQRVCISCVALSRQCSFSSQSADDSPKLRTAIQPFLSDGTKRSGTGLASEEQRGYSREFSTSQNTSQESLWMVKDEGGKNHGHSGSRFSRETVRLLRNWLSVHHAHPYPTEGEKDDLQQKTGLTKVQITNWLANARRRGQVRAPRARSPNSSRLPHSINISKQPSRNMDPMERWKQSPPENEPASAVDIAKAAKSSSNVSSNDASPYSYPRSEERSPRSIARGSSASSRNTSRSSHASHGSGHSHQSRGSFGSFGQRGRRRRRPAGKAGTNLATIVPRQYQCTFCIETFKTKHDWQRHEKSLHLSLERWVCASNINKLVGTAHVCPFCGKQNPDAAHYELHNYTVCRERSLEERTFYRKDHLRQHLRLVHECQFLPPTMESWKIAAPEVKSRCGFCALVLETWAARVDHLAEHYKAGKSMADWKGSWGFDPGLQKLVENGIPPYLIHSKRIAAMSYDASLPKGKTSMHPYDQVKARLLEFANRQAKLGHDLTNDDLRKEAVQCMSDFKSSADPNNSVQSWFADLIMCPDDSEWLESLRQKAFSQSNRHQQVKASGNRTLNINDKDSVERYCEFERQMADFVCAQRALGLSPTDADLRAEGCRILMEYDRMYSTVQSATAATWFCEQIMASHSWIERFRERLDLPPSTETPSGQILDGDEGTRFHNARTLEVKLAEYVKAQVALGITPSDSDIQRQARLTIFEIDDPFLQTAADDGFWLSQFKCNHGLLNVDGPLHPEIPESPGRPIQRRSPFETNSSSSGSSQMSLSNQTRKARPIYTFQDAKCYRRLELELSRFVASCMSENSPNPHVPSDDEIRRQARWIIYNDDDPWNQTAVDNEEWLLRFKRSNGLAPPEGGPGMPVSLEAVDMHFGGVGLTPPQLESSDLVDLLPLQDQNMTDWAKPNSTNIGIDTSSQLKNTAHLTIPRVAANTTFSSWDLESALSAYVRRCRLQGFNPSDEQLRAQARAVLGTTCTSADDQVLLRKFKQKSGIPSRDILPSSKPSYSALGGEAIDFAAHSQLAGNLMGKRTPPSALTPHWSAGGGTRSNSGSERDRTGNGRHGRRDSGHKNNGVVKGKRKSPTPTRMQAEDIQMVDDGFDGVIDPLLWEIK